MGVHIPVVAQMRLPMVLRTIEFSQLLVDTVVDLPGVQVERVPQVPSWRRQSSPTVALAEKLDALRPLRVWAMLGAAYYRGD